MPIEEQTNVTVQTIQEHLADLAVEITELQYEEQPQLIQRFGAAGKERTRIDTEYNLQYLADSLAADSPSLFTNYVNWLKILLAGYNVGFKEVAVDLRCMKKVLQQRVAAPEHATAVGFIESALSEVEPMSVETDSFIQPGAPYYEHVRAYTDLLLNGERHQALQYIMKLVEQRINLEDIYFHIFQPSQYEVGRLWQTNQINVAREHFCTAVTQMAMSQLYPYIFATPRNGKRMVAACVGDELHEMGIRMLSDFFEMDGWDTYFLGANVPAKSLVQAVIDEQVELVCLSATMTFHVRLVREWIRALREHPETKHVIILVGGYPFNTDPQLWKKIGADGSESHPKKAIEKAHALLQNQSQHQHESSLGRKG